jgi:hypothetical protein
MYTQRQLLINDLNNQRQIAIFLKDIPKRREEYRACLRRILKIKSRLAKKGALQ